MRGLSTRQRGVRIDFAGAMVINASMKDDDHSSPGRFLARECGKISQIPRLKRKFRFEMPRHDSRSQWGKLLPSAGFRYLVYDPFRGFIASSVGRSKVC